MLFSVMLFTAAAVLAVLLIWNIHKSLYRYYNVELAAGVLFCFIMALLSSGTAAELNAGTAEIPGALHHIRLLPTKFSYYALLPLFIMAILLIISNIALIRHEGFRPKNMMGIAVSFLYIGGTAVLYLLSASAPEIITAYLLTMLCYYECILAGTAVMGFCAARQKPAYDKDFIIIPGCLISKTGGLLPLLKGRTNRAIRYAWDQERACGKPLRYVPSGGQGPDEVMSEGSAMELYLLSHGAEEYEVFAEKKSRNTKENFVFSKAIIDRLMPDARIAFATTNYHMLRCGLLAQEAGIDAEGIASDTRWYFWPNGFIREFFAILNMHRRTHICVMLAAAVLFALLYALS